MEVQGIINKYSRAYQFLNGIGLNLDAHMDPSYPPFNDTPILQYYRNTTSLLVKPLAYNGGGDIPVEDSPIIGLPQTSYTDFHVMSMKDDIEGGMDVSYYGPLQFGTPGQDLTVSVDTGSADLWIPTTCPSCSNAQFAPAGSSTFQNSKRKVSLVYGAGRVSGTVARDTVSLGSLSVDQQHFIAVRTESEDFMEYPSSGLLGLAFKSISQMNTPNFFENLLSARKLAAGIFSIHLTRGQEDGSQICFGCYDLTKTVGPTRWLNLTTRTYWTINMDGITSNKLETTPTNLTAAIDSGTSLMLVPDTVAKQFYGMIPGSKDASMERGEGFYTYPCSSPITISLSFSGKPFSMRTDDFNIGKLSEESTDCVGGIVGVDPSSGFPSNLAIVGDVFLKSWYTTFDYGGNRVGFAPSVNNK
ncbi:aspartic peptidase domain-containing protein [Irpex rosettiformis]|uniref:Aspartic peptidase domain-containing protein n=1 Tax=Irpex rosettiformis TaxID=378272 RepID=A0ACB8TT65_9APHY|nr:aspartic peptidase domain-containing protein [Irpex rosettiformis]